MLPGLVPGGGTSPAGPVEPCVWGVQRREVQEQMPLSEEVEVGWRFLKNLAIGIGFRTCKFNNVGAE